MNNPDSNSPSLEGLHATVVIPHHDAAFWKQWRAYVGPALLISIGYMDPGNWGTDLQSGAQFKYNLLWVVAVSSLMAIFLQVLSARLGVVTAAGDVLLLLALQHYGMRKIEAVVLTLVSTIALCYFIEIFVIPQTRP